jgi:dolichol-phosphate mannosyltransferase
VFGGGGVTESLSVVVPAYKEEVNIERVYERLSAVLDGLGLDWELIFSVDPSPDRTEELILALRDRDPRVKMLRFSRRFGQPMATIAGLEAASGDAVVVIDCDLQDPPELIAEMVTRWREGFDVVYAQRRSRAGETLPKRIVSRIGYKIINRIAEVNIPPNTGDFRLMSRRVVENVVALKEHHGFLRGLVGLVGFAQTSVLYDRDARAGGTSKYNQVAHCRSVSTAWSASRAIRCSSSRCWASCSRRWRSFSPSPIWRSRSAALRSRSAIRRSSSWWPSSAGSSCSHSG